MEVLNKNEYDIFQCLICYKEHEKCNMVKFDCECKFYYCIKCFKLLQKKSDIKNIFSCSICKKESIGLKLFYIIDNIQKDYYSVLNKFFKDKKSYGEKRKSKYFTKVEYNNDFILIHNSMNNMPLNWFNSLLEFLENETLNINVNKEIIKAVKYCINKND